MKATRITVIVALALAVTAPAQAQNKTGPVASNAYITQSGLDWAWAYPLPAGSYGFFLSPFQVTQGWRLPTQAELAISPLATDFLFPGANVPYLGTDPASGAQFQATNAAYRGAGACATPWFSNYYNHCDWQDGKGQVYGPWAGSPGAFGFADQLLVRQVTAVPEPASVVLLASGLFAVGVVVRRRRNA